MPRRNLGTAFVLVALLGLLAWATWTMVQMWTSVEGAMGTHEWIAMILGIFFSCLVGFGLMGLMFFGSREGYDEPPTYTQENDDDKDVLCLVAYQLRNGCTERLALSPSHSGDWNCSSCRSSTSAITRPVFRPSKTSISQVEPR